MFKQFPSIGQKVPGGRGLWGPFLLEWANLLDQYAHVAPPQDAPQWHRERSNVGFLAAAAWRLGPKACALEEYREVSEEKKVRNPDLWFRARSHDFCLEVKLVRKFYGDAAGPEMGKVGESLKRAIRDVNKCDRESAGHGMGVCVASIFLPGSSVRQDDEHVEQITKEFGKFSGPGRIVAISWLSPKKRLALQRLRKEEYVPAGTALVGQLVWSSRSSP